MSYECYKEYGCPKVINDKVLKVLDIVADTNNVLSGGHGHIVLEDWNLEDHHINFCIKDNYNDLEGYYGEDYDELSFTLVNKALIALKELTMDERATVMAINDRFINIE